MEISTSKLIYIAVICLSLFALSSKTYALDPTSTLPIEIESDRATLDDGKGLSVYTGNVVISQGETKLEADEISVTAKDRRITQITANGSPAHFVQKLADEQATHGYAKTIIYTASNSILTFREEAKLSQQNNSFSGELIEYDIEKRAIKAKGNEEKGERVRIQYHPTPAPSDNEKNNEE